MTTHTDKLKEALEACSSLIQYQYTGSREAMNALQDADNKVQEALASLEAQANQCDLTSRVRALAEKWHTVGGVLGHKSAQSTKRYAHLATKTLAKAVANIGRKK